VLLGEDAVLGDFAEGPYFAVLESADANLHDCIESHLWSPTSAARELGGPLASTVSSELLDLILVDEATMRPPLAGRRSSGDSLTQR